MSATPIIPLCPDAPDIAEFAQDLAELGRFTSRNLAVQYLDQYLAPEFDGEFQDAVRAFEPQCRYYA